MSCRIENCNNNYTDTHYVTIEFPGGELVKDLWVSLCEDHSALLNLTPQEEPAERIPVKTHWWKRL